MWHHCQITTVPLLSRMEIGMVKQQSSAIGTLRALWSVAVKWNIQSFTSNILRYSQGQVNISITQRQHRPLISG